MTNILHSSETNEWYTPPEVVDLVRFIFSEAGYRSGVEGKIDLDPASNARANIYVGAKRYYTVADDGLNQSWGGRHSTVFVNPPYGRGTGKWVDKALIEEGPTLMLLNATPDRSWFYDLVSSRQVGWVYFFRKRIRFLDIEDLEPQDSPSHGNCLVGVRVGAPPIDKIHQFTDAHESDRLGGWMIDKRGIRL